MTGNSKGDQADSIPTREYALPIIGIGASAGGLESLEAFFAKVPSNSNVAFVVIQHLAPSHKSIMDSILARYTKMGITIIEDGMKI